MQAQTFSLASSKLDLTCLCSSGGCTQFTNWLLEPTWTFYDKFCAKTTRVHLVAVPWGGEKQSRETAHAAACCGADSVKADGYWRTGELPTFSLLDTARWSSHPCQSIIHGFVVAGEEEKKNRGRDTQVTDGYTFCRSGDTGALTFDPLCGRA